MSIQLPAGRLVRQLIFRACIKLINYFKIIILLGVAKGFIISFKLSFWSYPVLLNFYFPKDIFEENCR